MRGNRMIKAIRHNFVAWLALFVALAGTSLAASHYIITSTHQIKPSVLRQLKGRVGKQGPPGPIGPLGPAGPQGTPADEAKLRNLEAQVRGICSGVKIALVGVTNGSELYWALTYIKDQGGC